MISKKLSVVVGGLGLVIGLVTSLGLGLLVMFVGCPRPEEAPPEPPDCVLPAAETTDEAGEFRAPPSPLPAHIVLSAGSSAWYSGAAIVGTAPAAIEAVTSENGVSLRGIKEGEHSVVLERNGLTQLHHVYVYPPAAEQMSKAIIDESTALYRCLAPDERPMELGFLTVQAVVGPIGVTSVDVEPELSVPTQRCMAEHLRSLNLRSDHLEVVGYKALF